MTRVPATHSGRTRFCLLILSVAQLAPHYQLEVSREGHMDAVAVKVELRPDCATADCEAIARQTRGHIKSLIGISCAVHVGPPGSVPRSQGKAQRVIDLRRT